MGFEGKGVLRGGGVEGSAVEVVIGEEVEV